MAWQIENLWKTSTSTLVSNKNVESMVIKKEEAESMIEQPWLSNFVFLEFSSWALIELLTFLIFVTSITHVDVKLFSYKYFPSTLSILLSLVKGAPRLTRGSMALCALPGFRRFLGSHLLHHRLTCTLGFHALYI